MCCDIVFKLSVKHLSESKCCDIVFVLQSKRLAIYQEHVQKLIQVSDVK